MHNHMPPGRKSGTETRLPPGSMPDKTRLPCRFRAIALYTLRGCRKVRETAVEVIEISQEELLINSPLSVFMPEAFTLVLGARQHGIGCMVAHRRGSRLHCKLIRRETRNMVVFLSTIMDPSATLKHLSHPLFPKGRVM